MGEKNTRVFVFGAFIHFDLQKFVVFLRSPPFFFFVVSLAFFLFLLGGSEEKILQIFVCMLSLRPNFYERVLLPF